MEASSRAPEVEPEEELRGPAAIPHARITPVAPAAPTALPPGPARVAGAGDESAGAPTGPNGTDRKKLILIAVALALFAGGAWYGVDWFVTGRFLVSTDNAYVGADMNIVAPKVAGYVADVPVKANQLVRLGDVLVRLDDGDYRLALDQAEARLGTQDATIDRLDKQIIAAATAIDQARAGVEGAQADATRTAADFDRIQSLVTTKSASQASLDAARNARDRAVAALAQARAALAAAAANLDVLKAQKLEAERTRKELEAVAAKAKRDLDATIIRAPFDGILGNKSVETGDYVGPGKRLFALVPVSDIYVDANFKETQLTNIRPGQPAKVVLDADPNHPLEGVVDSFAPASGALFSLLPPENATGNFTKIVQRIPVRIRVKSGAERLLIPGLSVVVTVDTRGAK
ncbi:MAG TPA: HlyD family secretion protein [Xanthobacteraceae bacterium]|nr:HlyD family secretion protein [Xanthobacteraceae bacterium]